jgi:hypothetical protein
MFASTMHIPSQHKSARHVCAAIHLNMCSKLAHAKSAAAVVVVGQHIMLPGVHGSSSGGCTGRVMKSHCCWFLLMQAIAIHAQVDALRVLECSALLPDTMC